MIKALDIVFDKQVPSVEATCSLVADTKEEVNFEVTDAEHLVIGLGIGAKLSFGSTVLTCDGHFGILGSTGWVFDGEEPGPGPEPIVPANPHVFRADGIPSDITTFSSYTIDTIEVQNVASILVADGTYEVNSNPYYRRLYAGEYSANTVFSVEHNTLCRVCITCEPVNPSGDNRVGLLGASGKIETIRVDAKNDYVYDAILEGGTYTLLNTDELYIYKIAVFDFESPDIPVGPVPTPPTPPVPPTPPEPTDSRVFNASNVEMSGSSLYVDTSIEQNGISLVCVGGASTSSSKKPSIQNKRIEIEGVEYTKRAKLVNSATQTFSIFSFDVEQDKSYKLSIVGGGYSDESTTVTITKDNTTIVGTISLADAAVYKSDVELTAGSYSLTFSSSNYIYAVELAAV